MYLRKKQKQTNNQKEKVKDRTEEVEDDVFINFNLEFLEFAILETIYFNCGEICKTKYLLINC